MGHLAIYYNLLYDTVSIRDNQGRGNNCYQPRLRLITLTERETITEYSLTLLLEIMHCMPNLQISQLYVSS